MCDLEKDETNVEGIAAQMAASFPYEDPAACRHIYKQLPALVELQLAARAARHADAEIIPFSERRPS